ncbi:MAG: FkbM family methyltransferase [Rhizobiaceae bacterium]|nr:FkbM family methyltransferase [Rhizobiaceae bacterium]
MANELIFDVGAHQGEDTAFYLSRGYSVVAVEANPALVLQLRARFRSELASGQLILIDKAIGSAPGTVTFYVNPQKSDWGTIDEGFERRNRHLGKPANPIQIESITFSQLLNNFPTAYYIKIDIEGSDIYCLRDLRVSQKIPKYISIESAVTSPSGSWKEEISTLSSLGYTNFKFVNQTKLTELDETTLTHHGIAIKYRHEEHASGPFGEEAPGVWLNEVQARRSGFRLASDYRLFSKTSGTPLALLKLTRLFRKHDKSWYDLHARLGG